MSTLRPFSFDARGSGRTPGSVRRGFARDEWARRILRPTLAAALGLALGGLGACYEDGATLGFFCEKDSDCGRGQTCENSVCGRCGDGMVAPGELCFGESQDYGIPGMDIVSMFAAQLDENPGLDLVFVTNDRCDMPIPGGKCWRLHVLVNDGSGGFTVVSLPPSPSSEGWIDSFVPADLNGDGVEDLLVGLESLPVLIAQFEVLDGGGDPKQPASIDLPAPPRGVQVADLDGDDDLDVVVGSDAPVDAVTVYLNDGSGGFGAAIPIAAAGPARVGAPADVNGDGVVDLLTWGAGRAEVEIFAGDGAGGFTALTTLPTGDVPSLALAQDLDGDGDSDLVATLPGLDRVEVFLQGDGGAFGAATQLATLAGGRPEVMATFDVNEDERPDIAAANVGSDKVTFFLNRGGEFPDVVQLDVSAGPRQMVRQDFNGDGVGDLVVANKSSTVSVLLSEF